MAVSIIRNPVGTYSYVGSVPIGLAHKISGGTCFDRAQIADAVAHCGPGIARKMADRLGVGFETRTFKTSAEARDFAEEYRRCNAVGDFAIHETE